VQGAHDALVHLSGTFRTLAVSLYKIANDIRLIWAYRSEGTFLLFLQSNRSASRGIQCAADNGATAGGNVNRSGFLSEQMSLTGYGWSLRSRSRRRLARIRPLRKLGSNRGRNVNLDLKRDGCTPRMSCGLSTVLGSNLAPGNDSRHRPIGRVHQVAWHAGPRINWRIPPVPTAP
jgi:hypothetical protein